MRKKIIWIILFLVVTCGFAYRIYCINYRYPSPEVWTGALQDSVQAGNYRITFSGWQWSDGTLLHELCPGFCLIMDETGNEYPPELERVGIVTLIIEKSAADNTVLDLAGIAFESGAWGNQFDMELMYLLNPGLEGLRLKMDKGECREIRVPMTMLDSHFTGEKWESIDERQFYIVLQHYPEKLRFRCR